MQWVMDRGMWNTPASQLMGGSKNVILLFSNVSDFIAILYVINTWACPAARIADNDFFFGLFLFFAK